MTCERYAEMISAAIDGELTEAEASDLDVHVQACEACRARSDLTRMQHEELRSVAVPSQPAALKDAIRRKIGLSELDRRRAVWHVRHIPDRPEVPVRTTPKSPITSPIMGPWGRA